MMEKVCFQVGKTYEFVFFKGCDEEDNLMFDKANPDNWEVSTATIIKRTAKTVTIADPWQDGKTYRPSVVVDERKDCDVEKCWTYYFRMYADWKVTE